MTPGGKSEGMCASPTFKKKKRQMDPGREVQVSLWKYMGHVSLIQNDWDEQRL
jgi:hypothetical protein